MEASRAPHGWTEHHVAGWVWAAVVAARSPLVSRGVLATIALLGVFGSELLGTPAPRLNLDAEWTVGSVLTTALLGAGAAGAALLGWQSRQPRVEVAGAVLGATLAGMAADELLALHEHLEGVGGHGWVFWYLPVPAVAILAGTVLAALSDARSRLYLALGVVGWAVAAGIEAFLWGPGPLYQDPLTMPIEEVAEMLAALSIAAGLLRAAAMAGRPGSGGEQRG